MSKPDLISISLKKLPKRKTGLGKFLQTMGWSTMFCFFSSVVIMLVLEVQLESDWLEGLIMTIPFLAAFLLQFGKRLAAEDAAALLSRDKRPMVLILRAFAVDKKGFFSGAGTELNLEQNLVSILSCVGPVVAVGRPGEPLAPSGAARLYLQSKNWKHEVLKLMEMAKIVVLILFSDKPSHRAHEHEGFSWEVQEAMKRLAPRKLLIILPAATSLVLSVASYSFDNRKANRLNRQQSFADFTRQIRNLLPCQLPASLEKAQFLYFSSEGNPGILRSRARGLLGFSLALRPFIQGLGIKPPSVNPLVLLWRFNIIYRTIFLSFIFCVIIMLLMGIKIYFSRM